MEMHKCVPYFLLTVPGLESVALEAFHEQNVDCRLDAESAQLSGLLLGSFESHQSEIWLHALKRCRGLKQVCLLVDQYLIDTRDAARLKEELRDQFTTSMGERFQEVLANFKSLIQPIDSPLLFRATCVKQLDKNKEKSCLRLPKSQEVAAALGSVLFHHFTRTEMCVDLNNFQLELFCQLDLIGVPLASLGSSEDEEMKSESSTSLTMKSNQFRATIGLTIPVCGFNTIRLPVPGRTSMHHSTAYLLARKACIQPGWVVLDPCCGSASTLLEAASAFPWAFYVGAEIHKDVCEVAGKNLKGLKQFNVDVVQQNSRVMSLRERSVDLVLSDLPWGRREGCTQINRWLYPKLMKALTQVMKVGARAYLVTMESPLLQRTSKHLQHLLKLVECNDMVMGGYRVKLFVFERLDQNEHVEMNSSKAESLRR